MKITAIAIITFITLVSGCSDFEPFEGEEVRQYAGSVIAFSSQYSSGNYSASRALAEEDVYPTHADLPNAWASLTPDGQREFLVLGFDEAQTVRKIEIFETYYPGAIDTVYLRNEKTQEWKVIYSKPVIADLPRESRIFTIHLIETPYKIDAIRLAINSPAVAEWNEIDAIAITGQK